MGAREIVIPDGMQAQYDDWNIAPGLRVGGRLYCSGQIGIGPNGEVSSDPEAQFAQAFEHVGAILKKAGADFSDIVELTSFHVGLLEHMETFTRVRARYISEPYPAETAVGVAELGLAGALVEIRAIAELGD